MACNTSPSRAEPRQIDELESEAAPVTTDLFVIQRPGEARARSVTLQGLIDLVADTLGIDNSSGDGGGGGGGGGGGTVTISGTVSFIFPDPTGTQASPNTTLGVDTSGLSASDSSTLSLSYQWRASDGTGFVDVVGATSATFDPQAGGYDEREIQVVVTATTGSVTATRSPARSAAPEIAFIGGTDTVYNYVENPF